ncbi:electron transfer flavoprotein subunit beta/FixA family protein [Carboxydochorda subterranea]|uniref:Electron transfer flavoprotein small subunit n=1 Tax=Carboxydichorda subterranea TaxID=3109565 RepID=A0ABZ1BVW6_9FIRM|nr:electron transfer flavoprotein subunit beta/FixA family protein [Limnochorda sp. L945t]WRP16808.1 electron transfer flavoprotein subunit beta/FixA family protein [Limnochorda sp. L945t]
MHLVVCVKQVLDPEMSPRDFAIDPATKRPVAGKAPLVISTFDEIAVEVALKLREAAGSGTVSALSLGPKSADEVLRKAMAMQADRAVRIEPGSLGEPDAVQTASALAAAIRERLWPADVVFFGRQAGDTDGGQVGLMVAEILGLPVVTHAIGVRPGEGGKLLVERETRDGVEVVEVAAPVVVTVTNAPSNVPRIPKVKDVMAAHRKPIDVVELPALPVPEESRQSWAEIADLFVPAQDHRCRMMEGDSVEARVDALVRAILDLKVL